MMIDWKVRVRELAKVTKRSFIISASGVLGRRKHSEMVADAVMRYQCTPLPQPGVKMYSLVSGFISHIQSSILRVLAGGNNTKVLTAIVQRVVIDMVNHHAKRWRKNHIVHHLPTASVSFGVVSPRMLVEMRMPLVGINHLNVLNADKCNASAGKGDFTIFFNWERHLRTYLRSGLGRVLRTPDVPILAGV